MSAYAYLIFVAVVLLLAFLAQFPRRKLPQFPYVKHETLFTPAERSFLGVLEQSVGADYRIMGKVRLSECV